MNTTQAPIDPTTMGMEDPAEVMAARRKQELAMALLKQLQGGAPQPQQTRILAKQSLGNVLMNTAAQSIAGDRVADADKQMGAIAQRQQGAYSAGVGELMKAPDQKAAIAKAMASNNPALRALAAAQEKARAEAAEKAAERQRQLRQEGAKALIEKGDTQGALQILAENGVVDPNRQVPAAPAPTVTPQVIDGKTYPLTTNTDPKSNKQTGTLTAPSTSITNTLSTGPAKVGLEKLFGAGVDQVVANSEKAQGAIKLQGTLMELESRSKNGIIDGPASVPMTWIAGLAKSAGLPVDSKKLADTETFNAFANEAVQNLIQQMPRGNAGITAPEAARIALIMPNAAQSAETRAEIVAILRAANERTVAAYRQSMSGLVEAINEQDPKKANFNEIFLPSALDPGAAPTKTPMNPSPGKPPAAAKPPTSAGGQSAEVLAERIKIVQREFDTEKDPGTKAALGRELSRLKATPGAAAPAPASGQWRVLKDN